MACHGLVFDTTGTVRSSEVRAPAVKIPIASVWRWEGPTSVSVETLDGKTIVGARKTDGVALLDLERGAMRVTA